MKFVQIMEVTTDKYDEFETLHEQWLAATEGERTTELAAACEAAGVVVRPFAGEGARVTIGEPEANDVFLQVAKTFAG